MSNWKKLIVSGSGAHLSSVTASSGIVVTGSLLITGSKTIIGQSFLTGSLFITGSESIVGYLGLNSVANLSIPTDKSASYIYTSGSTNDLYFTQYQGEYTNTTRLRWLESQLSTGILNGGVLSSTTGSTQFTVTGGEGIIVTQNAFTGSAPYPTIKLVSWPTQTLPITYSGSAKLTYVGINNVGTIVQQTVPWGSTDINQYDTEIELGVVLHLSGSVSTGVFNAPQIAYGHPQQADDFIRAFGPLKISGHTLQASGSTLSLIKSDGRSYLGGANYLSSPNHPSTVVENAVTVSKIYRYYTSGSTTVFDTGVGDSGYTTIDPTKRVDTTTGTLTPVAINKYSLQRVFWIPNSPRRAFVVYYGNAEYGSLIDALNAKDTEPFSETAYTANNAIFLGWIAVAGGASSLTNPADATIAPAGIFRSIGGIGSTGTTPVSTTLAGLSDVSVASRTIGDLLYYNGSQWENTKSLTGNYSISGSLSVGTTIITNGSVTGSLQGSSSYSTNSLSASFARNASTASYVLNAVSSSFATTASYVLGGGGASVTNPGDNYLVTSDGTVGGLVGEGNLTFDGSTLDVTGRVTANSFTGSLLYFEFNAGTNTSNGIGIGNGTINNYTNGIGIGDSFDNYSYGIGIGHANGSNYNAGVGVGYGANTNHDNGVGIGSGANLNYTSGIGIGNGALENYTEGVGIGIEAGQNYSGGVGIGASAITNGLGYGTVALGAYSIAQRQNEFVTTATNNVTNKAQSIIQKFRNVSLASSGGIWQEIFTDASSGRLTILASSVYQYRIQINAIGATGFLCKTWEITGAIKRDASNNTTMVGGSPTYLITSEDSGTGNWDVRVTADNTNEALEIEVKHDYVNNVTISATIWATETRL